MTEGARRFHTTRWSLVAAASAGEGEQARAALEELCAAYWYPLYAFQRRRGSDIEEASDLVQGFFAALLEKGYVAQADKDRGRFRTFLMTALRHFASKEWAKAKALKRGGGKAQLSLDFEDGERRYQLEPSGGVTAEALFERRWALTLIERALERLAAEHRGASSEKAERFEALRPYLSGRGAEPYRDVGLRLGMTETAVKVAVHRMKGRYRDLLRDEIAQTVGAEAEIDDEIRRLMGALRGSP
ncbi:MAG: sigma-70 family RNA polymerase sigma factor [Planctomycetota bacterium]|nr:sigma-70 family RNA polymerase sigma factor [Planctomycetota bacterium]